MSPADALAALAVALIGMAGGVVAVLGGWWVYLVFAAVLEPGEDEDAKPGQNRGEPT